MDSICQLNQYRDPFWFWVFTQILLLGLGLFLFRKIRAKFRGKLKFILIPGLIFSFILFSFINLFILAIIFEPWDDPAAGGDDLNAAIKNTCYLDPEKEHCPTNLTELINIEKDKLEPQVEKYPTYYKYFSETNDYILIQRVDDHRAAIYSPRLTTINGLDLTTVKVISCRGKYQIVDPPKIEGLPEYLE